MHSICYFSPRSDYLQIEKQPNFDFSRPSLQSSLFISLDHGPRNKVALFLQCKSKISAFFRLSKLNFRDTNVECGRGGHGSKIRAIKTIFIHFRPRANSGQKTLSAKCEAAFVQIYARGEEKENRRKGRKTHGKEPISIMSAGNLQVFSARQSRKGETFDCYPC